MLDFRLAKITDSDIWVYDLQRDLSIRLTNGPGVKDFPVWSPDGRYLIFAGEGAAVGMYWTTADGAGKPEKLIDSRFPQSPGNFRPTGSGSSMPARRGEPSPASNAAGT